MTADRGARYWFLTVIFNHAMFQVIFNHRVPSHHRHHQSSQEYDPAGAPACTICRGSNALKPIYTINFVYWTTIRHCRQVPPFDRQKNSKWTWLKNYSQFHLLNWKGCSSPPISQHLSSHTWRRVGDLFLGTFLLLWLWCPLFPSESLGLAPFLLSSHSSCDPRLGKLCRQFTCMGANRTCVILRHSSRPSSSYNGGFLSNSLDNFGQARSPWTT